MADARTIDVYNSRNDQYRKLVESIGEPAGLKKFIAAVPSKGTVLDFGCGVGNCAAIMRDRGLQTDCIDASPEMVKSAAAIFNLDVRLASFSELNDRDYYDGIWANFSLLHAPKAEFPNHIDAIYRALRLNGVFFIALKIGNGEKRDELGRFYAYYEKTELVSLIEKAGFAIDEVISGADKGLAGDVSEWVGLLCHKQSRK